MGKRHSNCTLASFGVILSVLLTLTGPAWPASCPVTLPYQQLDFVGPGSYGNIYLAVGLWPEGRIVFRRNGPGRIRADGSLQMKFSWWRLREGKLEISGRKFGETKPNEEFSAIVHEGYGSKGFQASNLIFPEPGCWEITGHLGTNKLTFVTLVLSTSDTN